MSESSQQSRLKDLIAKGKEQNYLTYAEVNDHLPEDISDPDQVEEIIQMINDILYLNGVPVPPDTLARVECSTKACPPDKPDC